MMVCVGIISGFGSLVVSMLASGTQDRGFEPGRRGCKAVCSMSKICNMLKNPAIYGGSWNLQAKFIGHFSLASVPH
jgi:hypothetical protein